MLLRMPDASVDDTQSLLRMASAHNADSSDSLLRSYPAKAADASGKTVGSPTGYDVVNTEPSANALRAVKLGGARDSDETS